jgi:hypothetical protein
LISNDCEQRLVIQSSEKITWLARMLAFQFHWLPDQMWVAIEVIATTMTRALGKDFAKPMIGMSSWRISELKFSKG